MNDHSMRDAYERHLREGDDKLPPVQLPFERLDALVSREGSEADRLRALDIAMSTTEGRREFEMAWAAARAARPPQRSWANRRWIAAAAMLVVAVGVGPVLWNARTSGSTEETQRGTQNVESPLQLVTPRGEGIESRDVRFAWRRLGSAQNYMLVVVDLSGKEVFASTTRDTAITLPDSIRLELGAEYLWWVQAAMSDGSTVSAVTERVRVQR